MAEKKTLIKAHIGTSSLRANLYDLGNLRIAVSREFYQASCEIKRFDYLLDKDDKKYILVLDIGKIIRKK